MMEDNELMELLRTRSYLHAGDDDFIKVVRCKNCGYYNSEKGFCVGVPGEPPAVRLPDDYCSNGRVGQLKP